MPKKKTKKKKNFTFKNAKGIEYEVIFRKPDKRLEADGLCYSPSEDSPKIYISPHLTTQSELNTIIHEFAHAFFWNRKETQIAKFANALSRFLFNEHRWRKESKNE